MVKAIANDDITITLSKFEAKCLYALSQKIGGNTNFRHVFSNRDDSLDEILFKELDMTPEELDDFTAGYDFNVKYHGNDFGVYINFPTRDES